ncbi:MAG: VWA domain-containing protein, partial [Vicinamibacterales bacterium]
MFGLSFLSPLFLAGAAAAAIPIALHLFHRRIDPVIDFAAIRYLRAATVEQASRRRFRELLLVALRVAALVILAVAFARPYLAASAADLAAPATLVLIDTSASLSAPGQFARARALATAAIRSAPAGQAVGVLTFGNGADLVAPLSLDRAGALAAVEAVTAGGGATGYRAALARAAEALGDRSGRFLVITDLQKSAWDTAGDGSVSGRVSVEVIDAGGPASNVGISSLHIDVSGAVAVVHNYSPRAVEPRLEFAIDGRHAGSVQVKVGAGSSAEVRFDLEGRSGGALTASVGDTEGYAADNVRYAVMDAADRPSVLIVTPSGAPSEALYLSHALEVTEGAGGIRPRVLSGSQFSELAPERLAEVDALAILGTRGIGRRGRELLAEYVSQGGGLLVGAGPAVDPVVIEEALSGLLRSRWRPRAAVSPDKAVLRFAPDDIRHPVFRLLGGVGTLTNVAFERSVLVAPGENADVIARFSDGSPALIDEQVGNGRVLIFASDLNREGNSFPLQPAFVPFVVESLRYLEFSRASTGASTGTATRSSRTEYLVGDLPGAEGASPGIVRIGGAEGQGSGRRVAVNVDARESDPTRIDADAFGAMVSRLQSRAAQRARADLQDREDTLRLWQYGLALLIVSLAAESVV